MKYKVLRPHETLPFIYICFGAVLILLLSLLSDGYIALEGKVGGNTPGYFVLHVLAIFSNMC